MHGWCVKCCVIPNQRQAEETLRKPLSGVLSAPQDNTRRVTFPPRAAAAKQFRYCGLNFAEEVSTGIGQTHTELFNIYATGVRPAISSCQLQQQQQQHPRHVTVGSVLDYPRTALLRRQRPKSPARITAGKDTRAHDSIIQNHRATSCSHQLNSMMYNIF